LTVDGRGRTGARIALVTPNFNGDAYLRATIESVLGQSYDGLEYVIVDGASTDRSIDIVRDYENALHAFISEPDQGHADAINKGFARTSGEIMGWINSDDVHHDRSLETIAAIFDAHPEVEWITGRPTHIGERSNDFKTSRISDLTYADFLQGRYQWIQQESTFWRRSLWDRAGGGLDTGLTLANDFDLWLRFFRHARLHTVDVFLGAFRHRAGQRSALHMDRYHAEAAARIRAERQGLASGTIAADPALVREAFARQRPRARAMALARTTLKRRLGIATTPAITSSQVQEALARRWLDRLDRLESKGASDPPEQP